MYQYMSGLRLPARCPSIRHICGVTQGHSLISQNFLFGGLPEAQWSQTAPPAVLMGRGMILEYSFLRKQLAIVWTHLIHSPDCSFRAGLFWTALGSSPSLAV